MKRKLRIGIVGCGAIGTSLASTINQDFYQQARLAALYDQDKHKAFSLARRLKDQALSCPSLDSLIRRSDLVVEAAQAKSAFSIARKVLGKGRDIVILSVGGVVGKIRQLSNLAQNNQARVYVPSGAICGIDALKAVAEKRIKRVILVTRKHPRSFANIKYIEEKGIRLDKITRDTVLFSGNAAEAIRFFPRNINVAGILSIAGIGKARTEVKIIASPKIKRNIHELFIDSDAGRISTRVENIVHAGNPKTSFLAALSVKAMLRQILEPVKIGT